VLAVDQDPLGKAAVPVYRENGIQYWIKPMQDGSYAAGIFNLGKEKQKVTVRFADLKLEGKRYNVRDLWRQKTLGDFEEDFEVKVPAHGVVLVKLSKKAEGRSIKAKV